MLTNILGRNVCQFQRSLTPVNPVHLVLFTIPYRINSPCNLTRVFGILTIVSPTHSKITIQYNKMSFLWKYLDPCSKIHELTS